jgi:hypothetical protein
MSIRYKPSESRCRGNKSADDLWLPLNVELGVPSEDSVLSHVVVQQFHFRDAAP